MVERLDLVLADQPHARLGVRQGQALPVGDDLAADGGDRLGGRVAGVEELLAGGEELALGAEGSAAWSFCSGVRVLRTPNQVKRDPDGGGRVRGAALRRADADAAGCSAPAVQEGRGHGVSSGRD